MNETIFNRLGHGITCIDSGYVRPNLAAIYLIEHKGEAAIIETGTNHSLSRVIMVLDQLEISYSQVKYVIPTHIHLDHAGGAGSMLQRFPNAKLIVHPRGARHMVDPSVLVKSVIDVYGQEKYNALYGELIPVQSEDIIKAEENMVFDLSGRNFEIKFTPGHAEHHFCVWDEQSKGWFTGDTFGVSYQDMIGTTARHIFPPTTPTQFNPEKFINSIESLMSYEPTRMYLTHYGLLENPKNYSDKLCNKIAEYCEITQAETIRTQSQSENSEEAIKNRISEIECAELLQIRNDMNIEEAHLLLDMDMKLNAQGLSYWAAQ